MPELRKSLVTWPVVLEGRGLVKRFDAGTLPTSGYPLVPVQGQRLIIYLLVITITDTFRALDTTSFNSLRFGSALHVVRHWQARKDGMPRGVHGCLAGMNQHKLTKQEPYPRNAC